MSLPLSKNRYSIRLGPDGSLVYKCDGCRTYFKSKTEQREHARSEHKERLTCKYCNKLFSRIDSVYSHQLDHLRKVKKKERRFYCIKCGGFTSNIEFLICFRFMFDFSFPFQANYLKTGRSWMPTKDPIANERPHASATCAENPS